jgi:HEAT repeat protein
MQKLDEREPARPVSPLTAAPSLVAQFFLVPLTVVAVVVAIYGGFRMMVADDRTPEEYLSDVRSGGRDRRWPAAFELSRLMSEPDTETRFPDLAPALVRAFVESEGDDPRVRRYLALAIGRLEHPPPGTIPALTEALDNPDAETVISVIWALALIGDESVVPRLVTMYQSPDAGIRKMVVYALGVMPDDGTHSTLRTALGDPVPDVQWNAAVALARHGDGRGVTVLRRMLDREYVSEVVTPSATLADPASDVMVSGLRSVAALGAISVQENLRPTVAAIAEADQSLTVRQAAMETLEALEASPVGRYVSERQ